MTTHEYARYLLTLEDLPLLVRNGSTDTTTPLGLCYTVYWKPEWSDSIFEEEVLKFGYSFKDVQKAKEVFVP